MGEYIVYDGHFLKIGTCEDLFYTRLEQLREAVAAGLTEHVPGNLIPAEYLDPANGFRFRFPFPDEDGVPLGGFRPYDRGLLVELDEQRAPGLIGMITDGELWDHLAISKPCPMGGGHVAPVLKLTQQKQFNGQIWVVCDCPYCLSKVRLESVLARELCQCIELRGLDGWPEIVKRVASGYGADWRKS